MDLARLQASSLVYYCWYAKNFDVSPNGKYIFGVAAGFPDP